MNKDKIEPEPLSEMEIIRLKSVDPEFLRECRIAVKQTRDRIREDEYAALLKRQLADEIALQDRARCGFIKWIESGDVYD